MSEIPLRCYAVSVILLRERDGNHEVLLMRRVQSLAGSWCQVAGGIEPGETAWQAALRETREETGLTLARLYSADICEQFYEADKDHISILPVFVGYPAPGQEVRLNHEHSDFRWMSFEEAKAAVPFGGQRRVLAQIEEDFVRSEPTPWLLIDQASDRTGRSTRSSSRSFDELAECGDVKSKGLFAAVREVVDRVRAAVGHHPAVQVAGLAEFPQMRIEISVGDRELGFQLRETLRLGAEQDCQSGAHALMEQRIECRQIGHPR